MDGYSYDSAGNLQNDGVHQYFYDAENRLIQVDGTPPYCTSNGASGTAPTACFYYDARGAGFVLANPGIKNGHRVHRTGIADNACNDDNNGGIADYGFDLDGNWTIRTNSGGGACASEVYVAGHHFGVSDDGNLYFDHTDWLGTSRLRNTQSDVVNGYAPETCTSLPFGDGLLCNSTFGSNIHFTGKEHDYESNLDYFGARYDESSMGRFSSPDPNETSGLESPEDPQDWNAYAYGRNNPLSETDPDGRDHIVCEGNGMEHCVRLSDAQFEEFKQQNPNLVFSNDGTISVQSPDGTTTQIGHQFYEGSNDVSTDFVGLYSRGVGVYRFGVGLFRFGVRAAVRSLLVRAARQGVIQGLRDIKDASSMQGASAQEVEDAVPSNWEVAPTKKSDGWRWADPARPGDQVRYMPGNPGDPNPVKQGPYIRISIGGQTSGPIPAAGNPTLPQQP
jgi:RHS repeat-associated protein